METKENRDGYASAVLTAEEVNLRMHHRWATLGETIYGKDTSAIFFKAGCDDIGWWTIWSLVGLRGEYKLRFDESDIISMMEQGGKFQGMPYFNPSAIYDILVEEPENVFIPSASDTKSITH